MDKKKEKMTPERRYELACLILGGVVLGGALGCILRPNEWTFAVIPLLGVCLTALLWCAAARLWLCRDKMCIRDRISVIELCGRALRAPHIKPETGAFVHGERSNNSIPAAPGGI